MIRRFEFEATSPHGIPGNDLFYEHVHPTSLGYRLMAERLAAWFVAHEDRLLATRPTVPEALPARCEAYFETEVRRALDAYPGSPRSPAVLGR